MTASAAAHPMVFPANEEGTAMHATNGHDPGGGLAANTTLVGGFTDSHEDHGRDRSRHRLPVVSLACRCANNGSCCTSGRVTHDRLLT